MTLIVTIALSTLLLQASNTYITQEFTVTQIALDAAADSEAAINQALEEIQEDKNISIQGGDTEKK